MKIRLLDTSIGLRCYLWPWALLVSLSMLQGWLHDTLLDGGGSGFDYLRWSLIVWLRHRKPTHFMSSVDDFQREMDALGRSPGTTAKRPRRSGRGGRASGGDGGR